MKAVAVLRIEQTLHKTEVFVDGEKLGLLQTMSIVAQSGAEGFPNIVLGFPALPEGAGQELARQYERHVRAARRLPPFVRVLRGGEDVPKSPVIAFYEGSATDSSGRTLDSMLAADDEWFERTHDFIQWMFPNEEPSRFNEDAPLLTLEDIQDFADSDRLRGVALESAARFRRFLRLQEKRPPWVVEGDHNHLRITRALKFLRAAGLHGAAIGLHDDVLAACARTPDAVGDRTKEFWREAMGHGNPS